MAPTKFTQEQENIIAVSPLNPKSKKDLLIINLGSENILIAILKPLVDLQPARDIRLPDLSMTLAERLDRLINFCEEQF
jgi:hypothetical protein